MLDHQHPRDLLAVKLLLDNEGITEEIRKAVVVYRASHDRPMHELLDPTRKDIRRIYEQDFAGTYVGRPKLKKPTSIDSLCDMSKELSRTPTAWW